MRRLFPDARAEEERYFAETGIFPVMHVVVLRRDVYEQRPWLAQSLYKAFEQARRDAAARVAETAALASLLPWGYAEAERTRSLMGADFWTLRAGREHRDTGDVRPVLVRAGADQAAASGGGTVRGRGARGVRDLGRGLDAAS